MILVNNRPSEYFDGMTIRNILDANNFVYEGLIIKVNGKLIEDESFMVKEGDDVKVIHICHGG